ncbi:DUF6585 family protein [Nocardia sp. NPDC004568]|uniref:DUF6585 family protein n=1 Tax=Nocardia sp. NPDC004568 TaxID=3154551 RepID=UPI0033A7AC4A
MNASSPAESARRRARQRLAQRGPQTEHIPKEAQQAATSKNLGAPEQLFGNFTLPSPAWALGFGAVVAAVFIVIGVFVSGVWSLVMFVIAALVVAFFVWGAFFDRPAVTEQVYLFEHGLVHRDGDDTMTALAWDEVRLLRSVVDKYHNGVYRETIHKYTFLRQDGSKLVLDSAHFPSGEVGVLGEAAEQRISAVRLPRALEALAAGKQLDFGDLSVDIHGLSGRRGTLTWSEIGTIDVNAGVVRIEQAGKWLKWSKVPVSEIPDVTVLLVLADTLRRPE